MEPNLKGAESRARPVRGAKAASKPNLTKGATAHESGREGLVGQHFVLNLMHFGEIYRSDPSERIAVIKHGVEAGDFARIARSMARSKEELSRTLGLSVTTIDRKAKAGEKLSPDQGERVVGIAKLIGQVQTMVEQSGDPIGFDAAQWLACWLDEPLPALGGQRPAEYMDTAEGRELVSSLLAMAQSGAYA